MYLVYYLPGTSLVLEILKTFHSSWGNIQNIEKQHLTIVPLRSSHVSVMKCYKIKQRDSEIKQRKREGEM